jgi:hypothetical protein
VFVVMVFLAACGTDSPDAASGGGTLTSSSSGPQPCLSGWSVARRPFVSGVFDELLASSAVSHDDVWAVGTRQVLSTQPPAATTSPPDNRSSALIEHWDGRQWTEVPGADLGERSAALSDVVAVAANDVWSVGSFKSSRNQGSGPLIEHWDGRAWSLVEGAPFPSGGDEWRGLQAIAVVSSADIWIKGGESITVPGDWSNHDIYEHWDGRQWTLFEGPQVIDPTIGSGGTGPISADRTGDVWAVGQIGGFEGRPIPEGLIPLVERWDGSSWARMPAPDDPYGLVGLAVVSASDIWAIQYPVPGGGAQFVHWDGTSWTVFGSAAGLGGFAVRAPNDIWAFGGVDSSRGPAVQHWDGQQWNPTDTQPPASVTSSFRGASVTATGTLVAFGTDYPGSSGMGGYSGPPDQANNYLWINCA